MGQGAWLFAQGTTESHLVDFNLGLILAKFLFKLDLNDGLLVELDRTSSDHAEGETPWWRMLELICASNPSSTETMKKSNGHALLHNIMPKLRSRTSRIEVNARNRFVDRSPLGTFRSHPRKHGLHRVEPQGPAELSLEWCLPLSGGFVQGSYKLVRAKCQTKR